MDKMTKLTKMIYVASPYTYKKSRFKFINKLVQYLRFLEVSKITGRLQEKYPFAFIGPITQSHTTAKYMKKNNTEFSAWKTRDLTYISRCNVVWVITMDGWNESVGVLEEIKFSLMNNKRVVFINPESLLAECMVAKLDKEDNLYFIEDLISKEYNRQQKALVKGLI